MDVRGLEIVVGDETTVVEVIPTDHDLRQVIVPKAEREDIDDSFIVVNLGRIIELYDLWNTVLPQVKPFYAVKCNPDSILMKTLAALGVGFDCSSKGEIQAALDVGVSPNRIMYANPMKTISHIKYAAKVGVDFLTFDCEAELLKIKKHYPSAKLLMRTISPSAIQTFDFTSKFGVSVASGKSLLEKAKELDMNVVGVSFHNGVDSNGVGADPIQYKQGIEACEALIQYGAEIGHKFTLMDIGGGFAGAEQVFRESAVEVSNFVAEFTRKYPRIEIRAEPGRYFATSPYTLAACIMCKKICEDGNVLYCMTDGLFGSLGHKIFFPKLHLEMKALKQEELEGGVSSAVFCGPTCAPDFLGEFSTSKLVEGDWVYFEEMGAYNLALISKFSLFPRPHLYYYVHESHRQRFSRILAKEATV